MEICSRRDAIEPLVPLRASSIPLGLEGTCIILVEDEPGLRDVLVEALTDLGCLVSAFADAPAALRTVVSDVRIDLIVTDVGLPGMSGLDMAYAAWEARPGLPVLFMSGHVDPRQDTVFGNEMWTLMQPGQVGLAAATEVIGKPFTLAALATRMQRMLSDQSKS